MIRRFLDFWDTVSRPNKAITLGLVFVCVAILAGGPSAVVSYLADRKFDREIQAEKALREKDIKRGDEAEARALAAEKDKAKLELAFELAGKDIQRSMEKIDEAEQKFNEQVAGVAADMPDCERYNILRASLKLKPVVCQ